ncbi:MAG TPA: U32 family peptidase [Clostridia bacterium]|nr:U32 family peptidase [Clostridia bacterium]
MAVIYGADAVYLAGQAFGLRAFADNFTGPELVKGVEFAQRRGVKVYITVNIFAHNQDLKELPNYLRELEALGVDGIIFSDPGVWQIAQEIGSTLNLHLSTQANTTNWASARFWESRDVKRIILARELSLEEIQEIRTKVNLELEVFVHGAMCVSYSGRCLLSNYFTGRDANLGECAQPCRWRYALVEEKRPGEYYPLFEDQRGTYLLNSQDLCLIRYLPELIKAGVNSFKIEGRMKSIHYVATVVKVYREVLAVYYANPEQFIFREKWLQELAKVSHRDYSTGFLLGKPNQNYATSAYRRTHDFIGLVRDYDPLAKLAQVEQRNNFQVGEKVEIMGAETKLFSQEIRELFSETGEVLTCAPHPQQIVCLRVEHPVKPWDIIRREKKDEIIHGFDP